MTKWAGAALPIALAITALDSDSAHAVGSPLIPTLPHSVEKYAQDLTSTNRAKRRFAARVLLRRVRTARRLAARGPEDDLTRAEAQQTLTDFDHLVAPRCTDHLSTVEISGPCADILRLLETKAAIPALESHLQEESRPGVRRRIEKALHTIRQVSP